MRVDYQKIACHACHVTFVTCVTCNFRIVWTHVTHVTCVTCVTCKLIIRRIQKMRVTHVTWHAWRAYNFRNFGPMWPTWHAWHVNFSIFFLDLISLAFFNLFFRVKKLWGGEVKKNWRAECGIFSALFPWQTYENNFPPYFPEKGRKIDFPPGRRAVFTRGPKCAIAIFVIEWVQMTGDSNLTNGRFL